MIGPNQSTWYALCKWSPKIKTVRFVPNAHSDRYVINHQHREMVDRNHQGLETQNYKSLKVTALVYAPAVQ